ncbi:MAG TPA: M28 family peptidase [Candidatus Eisenbacteria bacterium]|nr:M28 family peptidase [Candidatus Eisenbacteria bacterium]
MAELADDRYQGRETGTEGHRAAALYVAAQFRALGADSLRFPGYLQPVPLISRTIDESRSRVELVRDGTATALQLGAEMVLQKQFEPATHVDARLVFVGYAMVAPEAGHDDLAGLDLRGAVAVFLNGGGPASVPEPLRSHVQHQGVRWKNLRDAGAIGWVSLPNPKVVDVPWSRLATHRLKPAMALAEPDLDERSGQKFGMTLNPEQADRLLAGTGHTMSELVSLADSGKALPRFPLPTRIRATVTHHARPVTSPNVVAAFPGRDPALRHEYVVVTAHLDHLGVGTPVNGDSIWNGAMDNAAGVATLIEVARAVSRPEARPRRSLLLVAVTAEEMGLLGSRYFAGRPPVPIESIVAELNTDMTLPIVPLERLIVFGAGESSLGDLARDVLGRSGVGVQADPQPARNRFVRSDQYNFIARGIPALAFTFGYHAGSPQESLLLGWVKSRYHAPSDDLRQPVDLEAANRFTEALHAIVREAADRADRPRWNPASFFKRFAQSRNGSRP